MRGMKSRIIVALAAACISMSAGIASGQLITPEKVEQLQQLKGLIYPGLTRAHAQGVAAGSAQPVVYAEMGAGPLPVAYYHFAVRHNRLHALEAAIPLPPGLSLAPVRIVRRNPLRYYITLTVYEVGGERSGVRAEWSTYVVAEGEGSTRSGARLRTSCTGATV
jgi:hypothetical protein